MQNPIRTESTAKRRAASTPSLELAYSTERGRCFLGDVETALDSKDFRSYRNRVNLIFTSPPFPLNRKKRYGNLNGTSYLKWLTTITTSLGDYLAPNGSLVIEMGNAWQSTGPTMSTLPIEALLAIKKRGSYELCQQFIWFNTAKLPSPIQWVNIERSRVKDSFTHIWWMSKSKSPKASNKRILEPYSDSMLKLLSNQKYNSGLRPSEHRIGSKSFLKDNGGSIPSNVLISTNTTSNSHYLNESKRQGISPHPARMPEQIPEFFIRFLTDEGDMIMDPFAGSNTTGAASERLRRRWISVEIDENYVNGSRIRFQNAK